jgi:hypothetical protein
VDGVDNNLDVVAQALRRAAMTKKEKGKGLTPCPHSLEFATIDIGQFEALLPGVSRRTLQRDLKGMADRGLLVAEGATNNLLYRVRPQE